MEDQPKLLEQLNPYSLMLRWTINFIVANTRLVETIVWSLFNNQSRNFPASDKWWTLIQNKSPKTRVYPKVQIRLSESGLD